MTKGRQAGQGEGSAEEECCGPGRRHLQHLEKSRLGRSRSSDSGVAVFPRSGNRDVSQHIEPEPQTPEGAALILQAIAKELQRLVAPVPAEACGVEAQQQSVELLRHTPP